MNIKEFYNLIKNVNKSQLQGYSSHKKVMGDLREDITFENILSKKPKYSGVLLLFFEKQKKVKFLLEERNIYKGIHSGQICLVGGKKEDFDISLQDTAIREAWEETQLDRKDIEIISPLTEVYIPPSNFLMYPFIAVLNKNNPEFINNTNEVKEFIEVDLGDLLSDENFKETDYILDKKRLGVFKLKGKDVWGATAMVLQEFKDIYLKLIAND